METSEKAENIYLKPLDEVTVKQEYDPLEVFTNTYDRSYQEQNECQTKSIHAVYIKEEPRESLEENVSFFNARHEDHVSVNTQQSPKVKQEEDLNNMASSCGQLLQGQYKTEIDIHVKEEPVDTSEVEDWSFPHPTAQNNHMLQNESKTSTTQLNDTVDSKCIQSVHIKKKSIFERRYKCMVCNELFKHSSDLKKHTLTHDLERPFQCPLCEKKYRTSYGLRRHELTHTGVKKHECQFCERKFSQMYTLKRHLRIHTGEKPFQCQFCGKRFANSYYLKEHNRLHSDEKPYQCEVCKKRFGNGSYYKEHLRLHTGEKPFHCKYCKTSFTMRVYMKKHELICKERTDNPDEKTEKLFRCKICEKNYNSAFILKQHERIHTDERPFQCSVCQKRFNTQSYLKQHERQHTGEKPFQCRYCDRRFSMSLYLYKHVKICKKNQENKTSSDESS